MSCGHCGAAISEGARFCPACGKAAVSTETQADTSSVALRTPDLVGSEIAGRYRILAKLGEGGMGAVYRGEQISLKRTVAVKVLRPELSTNVMIVKRFNAEAEAVAKLSHPNTVNIYDFGQGADGSLFIAMEFIDGRSLRSAIHQTGPLSPARALHIAVQIAASLTDAHAHSIVHRDLKPDNVMLQDRGRDRDIARVLDFGIAKLRDDSRATQQAMTQAGDMLGTPQYMAPEQIRGEKIDGRTDVYALGCLLYEMVTARLPFDATTVMAMLSKHLIETAVPPTQRRPDLALPPVIDHLVSAAMAKDVNARPATMEIYGEQLAAALATFPSDTERSGIAPRSAMQAVLTPPPVTPPPVHTPAAVGEASRLQPPVDTTRLGAKPPNRTMLTGIVLAIVAITGIGVIAATVSSSKTTAISNPSPNPNPNPNPSPNPNPNPNPSPSPSPSPSPPPVDPWAIDPTPVGTEEKPLGAAHLIAPTGFVQIPDPTGKGLVYRDPKSTVLIGLGPLIAGTNDPDALARDWIKTTSKFVKVTYTGRTRMESAGAGRDVLKFSGTMGRVKIRQAAILYITPKYRLALIIQAPASEWNDAELTSFLENNVILP